MLIVKIRQWIAQNSGSDPKSNSPSHDAAIIRNLAKEYCELLGPISGQLSQCAQWANSGLFVEACSVCDDYPDLLGIAKEFSFDGSFAMTGNTSASLEIAKLLQHYAPTGLIVPVISDADVSDLERAYGELARTAGMVAAVQTHALARANVALRVTALRKLFRDNPGSSIWQDEIRRIEGGAFEFIQSRMTTAHKQGDFAAAKEVMDELARRDWGVPVPQGVKTSCESMWSQLLAREAERRYGELERSIREASSIGDAAKLEELEASWIDVHNETGCDPSSSSDAAVEPAFQWLAADRERRRREEEFNDAVEAVNTAIEKGETVQEITRCYSLACSFEREVPSHLKESIDRIYEAIRLRQRRKTRMTVATIASVVILICSFGVWVVHRGHVREEVDKLVQQVEQALVDHQIPSAQKLLDSQPDLSDEVEVVIVNTKVMQARSQWEKDRLSFKSWQEEIEAVSKGDITKAKLDAMLGTVEGLKPSMTNEELLVCNQLSLKAKFVFDATVVKRLVSLTPKSNAFGQGSIRIRTLDQIPESDRYNVKTLTALREEIMGLIAKGNGLIAEYADIGAENLVSVKSGVDRLQRLETEALERIAKIGEFEKALSKLTDSFKDLEDFNRRYAAIIEDSKAVLAGLGLGSDFKAGRELALGVGRYLTWNALIAGKRELFCQWKLKTAPEPFVLMSLKDFITTNPDSAFLSQAKSLLKIGEKSFDERDRSAAVRIAKRIQESGMSEICSVPITNGSPVYRKYSDVVNLATGNLWTEGIMRSLADMQTEWEKLEPIPPEESIGYFSANDAGDCPTSVKIRDVLVPLVNEGTLGGTREQVLQLISQIAVGEYATSSKREDSLLRLWCVLGLVDFWMEELAFDKEAGIDQRLLVAATKARESFAKAVRYDWVVLRREKNDLDEREKLVSQAAQVLKSFASIGGRNDDGGDTTLFKSLENSLNEVSVVGVVAIDPFLRTQSLQHIGSDVSANFLFMVQDKANSFQFAAFQPNTFQEALTKHKSPCAPLLIFSQQLKKAP